MTDTLREAVRDRRVLVLGYGREGKSTFHALLQAGGWAALDVADANPVELEEPSGHRALSGPGYLDALEDYDLVFKTPGVVLPRPWETYRCRFTSQTEQFLRRYRDQVVGVTGTKGKSTTTTLIHHVLKTAGKDCLLAGNIGVPMFDIAPQIGPSTILAVELSCHQLEHCSQSPSLAVLLNLYEDHLDHYGTFENYVRAKENVYRHQRPEDTLYCGPNALPQPGTCPSRVVLIQPDALPFASLEQVEGAQLRGAHNLYNCAAARLVCGRFGVDDETFTAALRTYQPLHHRLEYLGQRDGVDYYDDSISTTAESAISAVKSIPNASILLLGGMDRGIEYEELADFLLHESHLDHVVLMYESGRRIEQLLAGRGGANCPLDIRYVPDLYQAADWVRRNARPGTACILSPASASYGHFKNFEERGEAFKQLIFGK